MQRSWQEGSCSWQEAENRDGFELFVFSYFSSSYVAYRLTKHVGKRGKKSASDNALLLKLIVNNGTLPDAFASATFFLLCYFEY